MPEGAITTFGYDINKRGDIAGFYGLGGLGKAVLWDQDGTSRDLPSLIEGVTAQAYSIDDRGTAVGQSGSSAVVWDRRGRITELPLPDGTDRGVAWSISDNGTIFGIATLSDSGDVVNVLWCRTRC